MIKDGLMINGYSANERGIAMGDDFIETLEQPLEVKEYIRNESRLEDGIRAIAKGIKVRERSFTLRFHLHGTTVKGYKEHRNWLYSQLYKGEVDITANAVTYHLIYTGKSIIYETSGTFKDGKVAVGFDEPNPRNRE